MNLLSANCTDAEITFPLMVCESMKHGAPSYSAWVAHSPEDIIRHAGELRDVRNNKRVARLDWPTTARAAAIDLLVAHGCAPRFYTQAEFAALTDKDAQMQKAAARNGWH